MAQRRMFSKSITNSSQFLMMPQSSQNLYFHLGMNADDDGFCEHFSIMRMTDSKPDDLKILQAKKFVNVFDDRVLVIIDWKENNYLRADRYTPSKYLEIYKEEILRLSSGIPVVASGKDRLGKVSIDKDSKEENTSISSKEENAGTKNINKNTNLNTVLEIYKSKGIEIPNTIFSNNTERKSADELIRLKGVEKISGMLDYCIDLLQETKKEEKRFILRFDTPFHLLKNYEAIKMKM